MLGTLQVDSRHTHTPPYTQRPMIIVSLRLSVRLRSVQQRLTRQPSDRTEELQALVVEIEIQVWDKKSKAKMQSKARQGR